jgi:hypothetical protein
MSPHWKISALALAIACATPVSVVAQGKFDGRWSVSATVDDGGCTGPYRYPIAIRGGIVDDASGSEADASGRVRNNGRLVGSIKSGLASIAVEGRLRSSDGSGRWDLAGPISCSGRWTARKSG